MKLDLDPDPEKFEKRIRIQAKTPDPDPKPCLKQTYFSDRSDQFWSNVPDWFGNLDLSPDFSTVPQVVAIPDNEDTTGISLIILQILAFQYYSYCLIKSMSYKVDQKRIKLHPSLFFCA